MTVTESQAINTPSRGERLRKARRDGDDRYGEPGPTANGRRTVPDPPGASHRGPGVIASSARRGRCAVGARLCPGVRRRLAAPGEPRGGARRRPAARRRPGPHAGRPTARRRSRPEADCRSSRSREESTVLGRSVAVPLVAGALLTTSEVGSHRPVGSGSDVVAVGLKAGAFPPDLAAGDRVQVVPVTSLPRTVRSATSRAGARSRRPCWRSSRRRLIRAARRCSPSKSSKSDADEVASLAAAGEASLIQVGAGG